jgi:hypothetical protein
MSVVIARDPSVAEQIVHAWPEPVPWGAELVCRDDEVAIVCPDWTVSEQLGPGRHKLSISNRSTYVLVYFVRTTPFSAPFDHHLPVFDRTKSSVTQLRYTGSVLVKVGDPLLLCSQIIGVPGRDLGAGVLRSASNSVIKALQVMVYKILSSHPAVNVMTSPAAVTQLVHMTASGNPMAIAVNGIDFIGFEQIGLSVDGGPLVQATLEDEHLMAEPSEATLRVETKTPPPRFPAGTQVLVYGADGLWHAATVQQFREGRYEVFLDGMNSGTWVDPSRVRMPS